ncbi:36.4 kDa proline-rich protein-like [Juglans microcarpa x Juglans regia]|uniref:36.4 kDa proline-rich protein-like n=1 Tax=Juglans microcarpa x Juglans regia TaxID=2249226 RepID=UPI001B7F1CFE|nr:36.4 kDa proline-rich protein-like [Juglans microcarpa x Juglans regia]XP_041009558.1 36.4 kDa proline-rich protein-like [Juglans microcarpa x Juglans regia]
MESSNIYALFLICILFIFSATPILGCAFCGTAPPMHTSPPKVKPPIHPPPIKLPPVTVPPTKPPVVTLPPIVIPPVILPPIFKPPATPPPVTPPPILTPPPPPAKETCPIDTLKLGTCVDLLGGLVHIGLGDPVVNKCCPVLQGLMENEAAVCMCTTLKQKLLNLNVFVPLALQLLATCGKTPPPGYTCSQ